MIAELQSVVGGDGQTTLPQAVRDALRLKGGEQLQYTVGGDHVTICVRSTLSELRGSLAGGPVSGAGLSFDEIRRIAAENYLKELRSQG